MNLNRVPFLRCLIVALMACGAFDAVAVQSPNPRGSSVTQTNARSTDSAAVSRTAVSRSAGKSGVIRPSARGAVVSNAARGGATVARGVSSNMTIRGTNARTANNSSIARTTATPVASRAGTSRATAVFNDISKIGGGYAACRESYATCMDQFCANANDTYRRCYCSTRFTEFRDTENALDEAKTLLMQFEDKYLNAVDKTADEVTAMYSATVGEAAIKEDTSKAAQVLSEIGDLLSGKKKASTTNNANGSMGLISVDISGDLEDTWSGGGVSTFAENGGQNLSELEGVELYNAAHRQCAAIVSDSCESGAVFDMARSSYSILITQDCNAYQKNINKKVENVKQTVRTAEKYLREARLEEYRSHNSADVNECISKVRAALTADVACGANYKRCLDYTGAYINQDGTPHYSPRLFQLTELINLSGGVDGGDVLAQNPKFDAFLETRKMFATTALDSCRDIAPIVWTEFKRTALIEIAQAQDEKIEEVKMSCVGTMTECYDTQSSALKNFDQNTAQMVGALSAYAAKQMCMDKVSACAALFSPGTGETQCQFDSVTGKLTNTTACGLTSLLKFVDSVDTIRIAEGCEVALKNYATDLCTPTSGNMGYPWNCRLMTGTEIMDNINRMSDTYCGADAMRNNPRTIASITGEIVDDIKWELADMLGTQCEELDGIWMSSTEYEQSNGTRSDAVRYKTAFYRNVYGTTEPDIKEYGVCVESTLKSKCEAADIQSGGKGYAKYSDTAQKCIFTTEYYQYQCDIANGMWENDRCYIDNDTNGGQK